MELTNVHERAQKYKERMTLKPLAMFSPQFTENLLILDALFEAEEWKYATFQLDKGGQS